METRSYTTIDRVAAGWPSGPWDREPDKVQWQDEATGLPCLAKRNPRHGNWCGYVGVTEGMPGYGTGCMEGPSFDVHGGITYGDFCDQREESEGICHVPGPGEPDHVWWLGFDCAHSGDYSPDDVKRSERGGIWSLDHHASYKSLDYVRWQCRKLAKQIIEGPAP